MELTVIGILHTLIHQANMADSYEISDSNLQILLSILRSIGHPKQSADSVASDRAKILPIFDNPKAFGQRIQPRNANAVATPVRGQITVVGPRGLEDRDDEEHHIQLVPFVTTY